MPIRMDYDAEIRLLKERVSQLEKIVEQLKLVNKTGIGAWML